MIDELFPTEWHMIATVVVLCGVLLAVGIWIGNFNSDRKSFKELMKEVKAKLELLEQSMSEVKAELQSIGQSAKMVEADQKLLRKSLKDVKAEQRNFWVSLKQVEERIANIPDRLLSPAVMKTNSPIKLSDFGRKISANLSVDRWAANHALRLVDKASGKQEFEIFEMCVKYVADQFDSDLNLNKNSRKGAYEVGTDVEKVKRVYAVELRDALLAHLDL